MKAFNELTLEELKKLKEDIDERIKTISDGFIYKVNVRSWGSTTKHTLNNIVQVKELAEQYDGDAGYARIYTNNKEFKDEYLDIVYIDSIEEYNNNTNKY